MAWSFSKISKHVAIIAAITALLYVCILMFYGRSYSEGDFTYFCKKGWGMLDGVSCDTGVKGPYWIWVQEGGRIVLMYDKAGAGISDKASVMQVGFNRRYLIAKLDNDAWYIFDHGDMPEPWFKASTTLKWVEPEGPYTKADVIDRIEALPQMLLTRAKE